jgi:hypothetical protein
MSTPQQISSPPAALAEVQLNENMAALGQAFIWAHDVTADTGLTVGLAGGNFDETTVADDTLACTDDDTNYIVVHRGTLVASVSTATTNWDDAVNYGRIASVVFAAGVLTAWNDERLSPAGIFDTASAVLGAVTAADVSVVDVGTYWTGTDVEAVLQEAGAAIATLSATTDADTDEVYTSDTGSTADSDPGNGLFKWNNATQASATELYIDNQTAAGVSLTTYFASLPQVGYIHLAQEDDATKWQLWKWGAAPTAGSGYYKFTSLTLMANGGSIVDNKAVSISFQGRTEGPVTTSGLTMATAKLLGRTTASTGAIEEIAAGSDLSLSGGSLGIANDAVTYAKLQNASATARVLARKTAGSGDFEECTVAEVLNFIASSAQGDILIRDATGWTRLGAGTAGQELRTGGAGANPAWSDQPTVVIPFFPGVPTASQLLGIFPAPAGITTLTAAAALAGSSGKALTAATAQTDIDVRKNATTSANGTSVGTIRWAAAGTVPTFIAASGFTLTGGTDYLTFWAPASPDATLANFAASIYFVRS